MGHPASGACASRGRSSFLSVDGSNLPAAHAPRSGVHTVHAGKCLSRMLVLPVKQALTPPWPRVSIRRKPALFGSQVFPSRIDLQVHGLPTRRKENLTWMKPAPRHARRSRLDVTDGLHADMIGA
jgi:hypothetical protein